MMNFLQYVVKVLTLLTAMGAAALTVWSIIAQLPFIMTLVGAFITGFLGYFSYKDIRNLLKK